MKFFVVVNKVQINVTYARYKIHHTPIQHTLNQHPVESRASHKNNACFEELVHSKHNFNWYKVEHTRTYLLPLKRTYWKDLQTSYQQHKSLCKITNENADILGNGNGQWALHYNILRTLLLLLFTFFSL